MNYSETVNLPDTNFSMKANLADNEPQRLRQWHEDNLYERIQENREEAKLFVLHDGPPYANGDIHLGHALNKILKDVLVKFKTMRGYRAPYRPGWDCHGLPIEHKVTTEQPETVQEGQLAIRKACREYALKYVEVQKEQFQRLGVLGEWDNPYLTLSPSYEASLLRSFKSLCERDFVYRQLKPIHWCWDCRTALAEAEVEYDSIKSPSIWVDFEVIEDPETVLESDPVHLMVWTTTPWTLPANVAVAVHPEYTYVEFRDPEGTVHLLAESLLAPTVAQRDWSTSEITIIQKLSGAALEGLVYSHPFIEERSGSVVSSQAVTLDEGTGCVHLAPGHGPEDYDIGQEYDLPILSPVSDDGTFNQEYSEHEGEHVLTAQEQIVDQLEELDALFHSEELEHSYPFCWRCSKPVIFRATPQWFLDVDHQDLRSRILSQLQEVEWSPQRGENRFRSMIEGRPDWCLSRQRAWGVPIPAVECNNCSEVYLDERIIEALIDVVEKEGVSVWFNSDVERFVPDDFTCENCHSENFQAQEDILDVWFDSGVSHRAVLRNDENLRWPADVYLEGSDQHRGWFQLSMIPAVALDGASPFRELITHGFVVDSDGEKMSKSKGNVILPQEVVARDGADILRLWVASEDYHDNLVMGENLLDQVRDRYRRIRNTLKFFLGNLRDYHTFSTNGEGLDYSELHVVDRWFLSELSDLIHRVTQHYQDREFHRATQAINTFCTVEASSLYIDVSRDRLYCEPPNSPLHESAMTTLDYSLRSLTRLIAPVLSFTADEVWDYVPEDRSVHETDWPDPPEVWNDDRLREDFNKLRTTRRRVMQAIESDTSIDDSDQAKVTLNSPEYSRVLDRYQETLPEWFLVSDVTMNPNKESPTVTVERADAQKCERCWRYRSSVQNRPALDEDSLCDRCFEVLEADVSAAKSTPAG